MEVVEVPAAQSKMVVRVGQGVGQDEVGLQPLSVELQSRRLEVWETRVETTQPGRSFQVPVAVVLDPQEQTHPHLELLQSQLGREQPLPYLVRP